MLNKRVMGFLRHLLLIIVLLCLVAIRASGFDSSIDSIHASWSSLKSAAATAEVRFLKTTMTVDKTGLSPEQVVEIVNGLEAEPGEELFAEVIHKMNPDLEKRFAAHDQQKTPWALWEERQLYYNGFSERSLGKRDEHLRTQNLHLVQNFKSRSVNCYELGQCPYFYYGLNWLLCAPAKQALEDGKVKSLGQGKLQVDLTDSRQFVIDAESHLPIFEKAVTPDGVVTKMTFFRDQTSFPGGVTLPAVKLQVSFHKGIAKYVMMSVILDAEFNVDIDQSKFEMPVTEGTVLADLRNGERRSRIARNDVANAVEYFSVSETQPRAAPLLPARKKGINWRALLLIANGVFLIGLGFFVWNKSR